MKVYLAGRISGNAGYKEEFGAAAAFYEERGFVALNPAVLPGGMAAEDYARICAAMIDSADAVAMLPGWEMSRGAKAEKAYAEYIGKSVVLFDEPERMTEMFVNGEKTGNEVRIAFGMLPIRAEDTRKPLAVRSVS